jgi:hypothetical protein
MQRAGSSIHYSTTEPADGPVPRADAFLPPPSKTATAREKDPAVPLVRAMGSSRLPHNARAQPERLIHAGSADHMESPP